MILVDDKLKYFLRTRCFVTNIITIMFQENRHDLFDEKGRIHCLPGWSDEQNMLLVPDCNFGNGKGNVTGCVNGNCFRSIFVIAILGGK